MRVNKNIEIELTKFNELNHQTIKKLQEPMRDVSNNPLSVHRVVGKWSTSSRMTATGGTFVEWNQSVNPTKW